MIKMSPRQRLLCAVAVFAVAVTMSGCSSVLFLKLLVKMCTEL